MTLARELPTPIGAHWNVVWDSGKKNYSSSASSVRLTYDKHGYGSEAGTNFRAQPPKMFPAKSATLAYKVFFPQDFDFVKGGKLPGLWGGAPGSGGGDWNDAGFSLRVMFREKGEAVAYVYMCTDQGDYSGDEKCKLVRCQGPGFGAVAHHTIGAGIVLWRGAGLKFIKGVWNEVELGLTVNTMGKADGAVSLKVNGVTREFKGVSWCGKRRDVNGIAFTSWMGGGSKDYAPDKAQWAEIKGVRLCVN
jgi:hypothetical protein